MKKVDVLHVSVRLNRTFVELKLFQSIADNSDFDVLIEPLWN